MRVIARFGFVGVVGVVVRTASENRNSRQWSGKMIDCWNLSGRFEIWHKVLLVSMTIASVQALAGNEAVGAQAPEVPKLGLRVFGKFKF